MKPDDFEQQLQRRPLRTVPDEWRAEILEASRAAASPRPSTLDSRRDSWWRELLWPCPQAWAGLAAVWVVLLAVNMTTREGSLGTAMAAAPSPATIMALREQRELLSKLISTPPGEVAEPPRNSTPRPRSERRFVPMNSIPA